MRVPPFNTGKVLIGCNYQPQPKPLRLSRTETMLQEALLMVKPRKQAKQAKQAKLKKPVTARPIDWDGVLIIAGCVAGVVLAYGIGWLSI